jgi:hypothetical protein
MGYEGFSTENFSCALSWREKPERALKVEEIRKGGIAHEASLLEFLIVRKQLSSNPSRTPLRSRRPRSGASRWAYARRRQ